MQLQITCSSSNKLRHKAQQLRRLKQLAFAELVIAGALSVMPYSFTLVQQIREMRESIFYKNNKKSGAT